MASYNCRMITVFLLFVLIGCATTPPAQFYLLTPMPGVKSPPGCDDAVLQTFTVGVGPVVLEDYLNRPQIMTRIEPNRIEPAEFHRWAGSLERDISRILVDNLGLLLAPNRIVVYPFNSEARGDYRVAVRVLRFDGLLNEQATLDARWTIIHEDDPRKFVTCQMTVTEPVEGKGYQDLVMAMSRTVAQLATRIAEELKQFKNQIES